MVLRLPALLLVALLAVAGGCASLEAARLADSGSKAIDRGDAARAISDLERAVVLQPEAAPLFNNLGVAYLAGGRTRDALRAFERSVALDCSHEPAQKNLRALRGPATRESVASSP